MPKARIVLRVRPRARRTGGTVSESGAVTVRVRAAPERGRANGEGVEALAHALDVPTSVVEMVRGHSALDKVVVVDGLTQEEAMSRLRA